MTNTSRWRRAAWWAAWCVVIFGLFNANVSHREAGGFGRVVAAANGSYSLALLVRAIRVVHVDDADINRYHAYANAVLGRPYQGFFVQPLAEWREDERARIGARDPQDPAETPPVVPVRRLAPYRDFSVEHLPLLFAFEIPVALVTDDMGAYRTIFSVLMGLLLTASLVVATRLGGRLLPEKSAAIVPWAVVMAVALGTILVRRYDAAVSLGISLAAWGAVARRPVAAGLGAGLAVAAKGVPIIVVPVAIVFWLSERRPRDIVVALAAAGLLGVAVALPAVAAAGTSVIDLLRYHAARPLHVESTWGAILLLSRAIDPASARLDVTFASLNVTADWDAVLRVAAATLPFAWAAAVCAWLWAALRRAGDERARGLAFVAALCAALAGWMVLGKVFSPQYLTWLLPLAVVACVAGGRRSCWHLLIVLALTQAIYPFLYSVGVPDGDGPWFGLVVAARNAALLAWAIGLLRRDWARVAPGECPNLISG